MELLSHNNNFQTQLAQLNFKTFYRNQLTTFGYDDLFSNQRVLVFSIPKMLQHSSYEQFHGFNSLYTDIINSGINKVCALSSFEPLIGAWVEKQSKTIIGLPDINKQFIKLLANIYYTEFEINGLVKHWQYVLIINDGKIEKMWKSFPYKENLPLRILKDPRYQYYKIDADTIMKYLICS
jgi:peroxiredoxin